MPEPLEPKDLKFLKDRRRFASKGNLLGTALLAGILASTAWMYWAHPRLANPFHVYNELMAGGIPQSMLEMMAAMLPILVTTVFVVLAIMAVFSFAIFRNERRYLKIIDRLTDEPTDGADRSSD